MRLARTKALSLRAFAASLLAILLAPAATASPPPASAFGRLPAMSMVRLSPDGVNLAWAEHRAGRPLVVMFSLAQGKVLREFQPGDDERFRLRNLAWADEQTLLLQLSITDTRRTSVDARKLAQYLRVLAVDSSGGPARILLMQDSFRSYMPSADLLRIHTGKPGIVVIASWDWLETAYTQGTGSLLAGGRKDSGLTHALFEVDTRTGRGRRIEGGTQYTEQWIVDGEGRAIAFSEWDPVRSEFRINARRNGTFKELYRSRDAEELVPVLLAPDGDALVAIGARGGPRVRAWRMPLDGAQITPISDADEDVEFLLADRFSGALAGLQLGGLQPRLHWLDEKLERMQQSVGKAFPGKEVAIYDRSRDYRRLIAHVESADSPPVYYYIDLDKGSADIVGEAYPELAGAALGRREATHYRARDGLEIPAYLTLPPAWKRDQRLPLVLLPHGGPQARDDSGFEWWAQFLATRGYAVLQPQFRGSTGFGAEVTRAGTRAWGQAMQDDLSDGVAAMVERGIADGDQVCIVGSSYGGYAALAGAAFTPELYRCAASINGISDLPSMYGYLKARYGTESDTLEAWKRLVGHPYDEKLAESSPARQAERLRAAVLLIHSAADSVVPIEQSQAMREALRQADRPGEFLELPGEDHWLSTEASRIQVLSRLEEFLARHLQLSTP